MPDETGDSEAAPKRRRRRRPAASNSPASVDTDVQVIPIKAPEQDNVAASDVVTEAEAPEKKKPARKPRRKPAAKTAAPEVEKTDGSAQTPASEPDDTPVGDETPAKPKRRRRAKAVVEDVPPSSEPSSEPVTSTAAPKEVAPQEAQVEAKAPIIIAAAEENSVETPPDPAPAEEKPAKRGWWRR